MSLLTKTFTEVGNAFRDAYGHVIHGDDAGTSETKALYISPSMSAHAMPPYTNNGGSNFKKFYLGMTFISVNDRAFVKSVEPDSEAARAGIRVQDCLQLVVVLSNNEHSSSDSNTGGENDGSGGDMDKESSIRKDKRRAKNFAINCEEKGRRTSFQELKDMFEHSAVPPQHVMNAYNTNNTGTGTGKGKNSNAHAPSSPNSVNSSNTSGPNIMFDSTGEESSSNTKSPLHTKNTTSQSKSLSHRIRSTTQEMVGRCSAIDHSPYYSTMHDMPASPTGRALHPVVLVFRHAHKRHVGLDADSDAPHLRITAGMPYFRLDDECERAAVIVRKKKKQIIK
jgi:hypothetical protein